MIFCVAEVGAAFHKQEKCKRLNPPNTKWPKTLQTTNLAGHPVSHQSGGRFLRLITFLDDSGFPGIQTRLSEIWFAREDIVTWSGLAMDSGRRGLQLLVSGT